MIDTWTLSCKHGDHVIDYPKICSPFVRQMINGRYVVTPEVECGFEWVFEDQGVSAVDKLHGSNHCVLVFDGMVRYVDNRGNRLIQQPYISTSMTAQTARVMEGILAAIERGWFDGRQGRVYGEVVGPTFNGNLHNLDKHYFVPFDILKDRCHWKSWIRGDYPKDFWTISNWFRNLPSLFTKKYGKVAGLAEGLIFYHPDGKRVAKLRRDMFDWYEGVPHG